jgi:hypothetical protein
MLFQILKLFGLDVPAKIEAVKAGLEQRLEEAIDHVKEAAQHAAVIAALLTSAGITGAMAFGTGLMALDWWTADSYGPYAGLAVVGGILVLATIALASAAAIKASSLASSRLNLSHQAAIESGSEAGLATVKTESDLGEHSPALLDARTQTVATAHDLVEPLAFVLSKVVKYPGVGNPIVDELIGNLRVTARDVTGEAVERAANLVRHGDRVNLVCVLTGAAFVGWLLAHHSRQKS